MFRNLINNATFRVTSFVTLISFLYFGNTLTLGLFADDFEVLYRIIHDNKLFTTDFIRPISDISLLFNSFFSKYNAPFYRFTNTCLHIGTSIVLYKALKVVFNRYQINDSHKIALIASILFAAYPYHSEPIIWIVGRASILSCFLGILAFYYKIIDTSSTNTIISCILLYVGLHSYEGIIILPFIITLLYYIEDHNILKSIKSNIAQYITILLFLIERKILISNITGNYAQNVITNEIFNFPYNYAKAWGRLFIPPIESTKIMLITTVIVTVLIVTITWMIIINNKRTSPILLFLLGSILITLLIPGTFPVESKTTEGERLLYFPSLFLCSYLSVILYLISKNKKLHIITITILLIASFTINKNNVKNWKIANKTIEDFKEKLIQIPNNNTIIFNLPDSYKGAYIFRNGYNQFLKINTIRSKSIIYNQLTKDEHKLIRKKLEYSFAGNSLIINSNNNELKFEVYDDFTNNTQLLFWNGKTLLKIEN